jgi:hypothetical protein
MTDQDITERAAAEAALATALKLAPNGLAQQLTTAYFNACQKQGMPWLEIVTEMADFQQLWVR